MITQQINFYQDRFRAKRLWISALQVAAALLVVIAAGAIWSFLLHTEFDQARSSNLAIKADRGRMTAELAVANADLSKLLEDHRLDREIETTARQISARKKVLNFVDGNRFGSGEGFSDYLVALSHLHVDDIWLNQIRFAEDFVQIKGSALNAAEVPGYFDRFSDEDIFQGNRFDLFQLSRASDSDWKVDFEIATSGDFNE
ncbi:MAG: PilN domain-containing protein [Gammaproteobacteria bacterium]